MAVRKHKYPHARKKFKPLWAYLSQEAFNKWFIEILGLARIATAGPNPKHPIERITSDLYIAVYKPLSDKEVEIIQYISDHCFPKHKNIPKFKNPHAYGIFYEENFVTGESRLKVVSTIRYEENTPKAKHPDFKYVFVREYMLTKDQQDEIKLLCI